MAYQVTPGQQALQDYGLAQAEAITAQSEAQFDVGKQSIFEKVLLENQLDTLNDLAAKAQYQARRNSERGGWGRFAGSILGAVASFAIPGLGTAARILLPAVGGAAGNYLAGGLSKINVGDLDVNVQDQMLLQKSKGKKIEDAYADLEYAVEELNDLQKSQAWKEFGLDALQGWAMLKYDNIPVNEDYTLGELRKMGIDGKIDYSNKDYLRDVANVSILGSKPEKALEALSQTSMQDLNMAIQANQAKMITDTTKEFENYFGSGRLNKLPKKDFIGDPVPGYIDSNTFFPSSDVIPFDEITVYGKRPNIINDDDIPLSDLFERQLNEKEQQSTIKNQLFSPIDFNTTDIDTLNQQIVLQNPEIGNEIGKVIYDARGLKSWSTSQKVEDAYRKETGYSGSMKQVPWEEIQPYIARFESSSGQDLIGFNTLNNRDIGINQINTGWLNVNKGASFKYQKDSTLDPVYRQIQLILQQYRAQNTQPEEQGFNIRNNNSLYSFPSTLQGGK